MVDSLISAGKTDKDQKILRIRSEISNSDPAITKFYGLLSRGSSVNQYKMDVYADSALAFFNSESRIRDYPNEYFNALLLKGDVCLTEKKYIAALNYYYKAKKVLPGDHCNNEELDSKMGNIYFDQKNYKFAARYWNDGYNHLLLCNDGKTPEQRFMIMQGALDNAGISYERSGQMDSARYFYFKDTDLINTEDKTKKINKIQIDQARVVAYDNLGGLNLKLGNLEEARNYINKSIAIPTLNTDGIKIPPLIKLAQLCLKTGDYGLAAGAFKDSRNLLDRFLKYNADSEIKWNKLYAAYLFKTNHPDKAYLYLDKYIRLRDSDDNISSELYRLDVNRELNNIGQQQALIEMKEQNKIRQVYMAGISIIGFLSIVIIVMVSRNLVVEKKNNKIATGQNRQLQQALNELERVNKDYIRMMRVMAHYLRNPLSGIKSLASLMLEDDEFSEANKHMLKLIETTGMNSMEMINELLRSGLAQEEEQIQKQTIDLVSLLNDAVELLQFRANEKKQQLLFESDGLPIMAEVNRENMWRVFNNLIVNAIKFSKPTGTIKVEVKLKKQHVLISVADNGVGIPDKDKNSVFDMFTTAKRTGTNGEESFGLGLSISKRIVENHKGKIWFESNPGTGTVFYIELPVTDSKV